MDPDVDEMMSPSGQRSLRRGTVVRTNTKVLPLNVGLASGEEDGMDDL